MTTTKSSSLPVGINPIEKAQFLLGKTLYNGSNQLQRKLLGARKKELEGIHYLELGDPKNPPLVFFHGFGDSKDGYLLSSFPLVKDYYLIVPDMPGFGENPEDSQAYYNMQHMVTLLGKFFESLQLDAFTLIGNSMGGAISMAFTLAYPTQVKKLVLLDSAGFFYRDIPSVFHEFAAGKNIFDIETKEDYRNLLNRVFFKVPYIPKVVFNFLYHHINSKREWYGKMVGDLTNRLESLEQKEEIELFTFNNKVCEIRCPTLLLWGENDSLFPAEVAKRATPLFSEGQLGLLKKTGHAPQYEAPRQYMRALKQFIIS
ncbi:MAG: alpha/beta hydrolase [Halobacteriovoraceae bacterium]|jgi:abhydrolase domain-containing protein 6|nr:alpha/beta hydrolase [Halobacteriovoraceae bacterium]